MRCLCCETQLVLIKMNAEIQVDIIHEETIKPSSPTPPHLKTTHLSVFDQLSPDVHVPLLLFYPTNTDNTSAEISELLKSSLSETLTQFYPFAGKFQYNDSINCNDHGSAFLEAQVNCSVSKILEKPNFGVLKKLLPTGIGSTQANTGSLLLVQANFFECGGLAIGVSLSHKVADASALGTFIKSWADIALGSASNSTDHHVVRPAEFGAAASLFPPQDFLNTPLPPVEFPEEKCKTKRFVFDGSKIAALKSNVASPGASNPTRVEVVSALIWKCAMEASRSNLDCVRPSDWFQLVNLRKILVQHSSENFLGNLLGVFATSTGESEEVDAKVESLVAKLRKGLVEFKRKYSGGIGVEEACNFFKEYWNLMMRDDVETYSCSSWCRFAFYESDFGWGKPLWVSSCMEFKNLSVFMDTRSGDGIEVWLTLKKEEMDKFECIQELLEYASLNPSVI